MTNRLRIRRYCIKRKRRQFWRRVPPGLRWRVTLHYRLWWHLCWWAPLQICLPCGRWHWVWQYYLPNMGWWWPQGRCCSSKCTVRALLACVEGSRE